MKIFLRIFLLAVFSIIPALSEEKLSFPLLKNVSDVETRIRPGDWVILDIDETLLKRSPSGKRLNLDPKVPELIKNLQQSYPESEKEKQIRVIFLTANRNEDEVRSSLIEAGFPESLYLIIAPNQQTNQGKIPTKGQALVKELRKTSEQGGFLPKRIIMIDDLALNLENIQQALIESKFDKIPYLPFLKQTNYKLYESADEGQHFPESLDGLVYLESKQGGSGGVHILQDPSSGKKYTFKCVLEPHQMKEEITADNLYRTLGIPVPAFAVYDTLPPIDKIKSSCIGPGPYRLADFIESEKTPADPSTIGDKMKVHFVADAFLGNWDIVVDNFKNVILDKMGKLWRVDNGGALRYRALGEKKNPSDLLKVSDLESMRNPAINENGAQVYGSLTAADLKEQAQALFNHREALFKTIDLLDKSIHLENPKELKEILRKRLDDLVQRFQLKGQYSPRKGLAQVDRPAIEKAGAGILVYSIDPKTNKLVVLLGKRINHNWWSNFGGKSDVNIGTASDKTLADTAVREVQEESLGLLSYTPIELANRPSHDIVNKDGVLYRMYVAPHPYLDVERLKRPNQSSKAKINKEELHWHPEYTDYVWMPLEDLLKGLKEQSIVQEEGVETIQIDDVILYPPLLEMLREPEVLKVLKLLDEGKVKTIPAYHTVREKDRVKILPLSLEQEKQQLAERVVRHGTVMAELKESSAAVRQDADQKADELGKRVMKALNPKMQDTQEQGYDDESIKLMKGFIPDQEADKLRKQLLNAPYTQTQAYLAHVMGEDNFKSLGGNSRQEVVTFLQKYSKSFKNINLESNKDYVDALVAALEAEKDPQNRDKIVFYHAVDPLVSFLYDFLSAFRAQLKILSPKQLRVFRGMDEPFSTLQDVEAFISTFRSGGVVDNYGVVGKLSYQDMGLSANPFLFGNDGVETSCSYCLFHAMQSLKPPELEKMMEAFFLKTGIPGKYKDYIALYQQYYEHSGRYNTKLFQIFIDPQVVDAVSYTSFALPDLVGDVVEFPSTGNHPSYHGFAKIIPVERTDIFAFSKFLSSSTNYSNQIVFNNLQARLFVKPGVFHNPKYVFTKTYWHHPLLGDTEQAYQQKLQAQVSQDLARWIEQSTATEVETFAEGTPALKKLYQQVYEGVTGLKYKEAEGKALLLRALSLGDFEMVKRILVQNPNIDLNEKVKNPNFRSGNKEIFLINILKRKAPDSVNIAKYLIEKGLFVDQNLFIWAIESDSVEFVRYLIDLITEKKQDVQEFLLPKGTETNPLDIAIRRGSLKMVETLLENYKKDPKLLKRVLLEGDSFGDHTPLHIAVLESHVWDDGIAIVRALLLACEDDPELLQVIITIHNRRGQSPLDLARIKQFPDVVSLLSEFKKPSEPSEIVNLSPKMITDEEVQNLQISLKDNTIVENLDLSHRGVTDAMLSTLIDGLKQNKTLKVLDLSSNKITDSSADMLFEGLGANTSLTTLNLSQNKVGNSLIYMLLGGGFNHIVSLDLSYNEIKGYMFVDVIDTDKNTTLKSLILNHNEIGSVSFDENLAAFSEWLQGNVTLEFLDLSHNGISDTDVEHLSKALEDNTTLKKLDLGNNPEISKKGQNLVINALKNNPNCEVIF